MSSQDLDFSLIPPGSFQLCHALRTISWNGERVENTSATQKPGSHLHSNWARFVFAGSYAGYYAVDQPFVILGFWERHKNYTEGAPLSHQMSISLQPMAVTRVARPPPLTYKSGAKSTSLLRRHVHARNSMIQRPSWLILSERRVADNAMAYVDAGHQRSASNRRGRIEETNAKW